MFRVDRLSCAAEQTRKYPVEPLLPAARLSTSASKRYAVRNTCLPSSNDQTATRKKSINEQRPLIRMLWISVRIS